MHTLKIRLLDAQYKVLRKEARKKRVSVHEVIDDWLLAGEDETIPWEPSTRTLAELAVYTEEELKEENHNNAERRALNAWHESLRKKI